MKTMKKLLLSFALIGFTLPVQAVSTKKWTGMISAGLAATYGYLYYKNYNAYRTAVREAKEYTLDDRGRAYDKYSCEQYKKNPRAFKYFGFPAWLTASYIEHQPNIEGQWTIMSELLNSSLEELSLCLCNGRSDFLRLEKALIKEQQEIERLREQLKPFTRAFSDSFVRDKLQKEGLTRMGQLTATQYDNLVAEVIGRIEQYNPLHSGQNWKEYIQALISKCLRRDLSKRHHQTADGLSFELYLLEQRLESIIHMITERENKFKITLKCAEKLAAGQGPCASHYHCEVK